MTDWRELLGLAEARLDDTDSPDQADDRQAQRATRLLDTAGDRESALAHAAWPPPTP